MKKADEIVAALSVPYAGERKEKNGFPYIPWHMNVTEANRIFGPDGWNVEVKSVAPVEGAGGTPVGYMAVVRVTVFAEGGVVFVREGVGFNDISSAPNAIDTAVKGAASDATSRALCLLGDAFGLSIRSEGRGGSPTPQQRTQHAAGGATAGNLGPRPTEKQAAVLTKNGVDYSTMDFKTWKAALDDIFSKPRQSAPTPITQAKAAPKAQPVDDDEFDLDSMLRGA